MHLAFSMSLPQQTGCINVDANLHASGEELVDKFEDLRNCLRRSDCRSPAVGVNEKKLFMFAVNNFSNESFYGH